MNRTFLLAGFLVLALGFGSHANAQAAKDKAKVDILVLDIDGGLLDEVEKAAIHESLTRDLNLYGRYNVKDAKGLDLLDAMVEHECLDIDGTCLAAIAASKGAAQVLYANAEDGKLTLVLVDVASASEIARDQRDASDGAAVRTALAGPARDAVLGPVPSAPKPKPKPAKPVKKLAFDIDSNVKDSKVFVDDKEVGIAPITVQLEPGRYTFRVEREGFLAVEERIQVAEVGEKKWRANMKPVPVRKAVVAPVVPLDKKGEGKDSDKDPFYATWWFWTGVGVAVTAAVITTAVLVSGEESSSSYGTAKFSVDTGSAAYDAIFYRNVK